MLQRLSPSFVVSVLALLVAGSGIGYAAATIDSADIKDNSVQSKDIRNGTIQAEDLKKCPKKNVKVFGLCMQKKPKGPTAYDNAVEKCSDRGGRLPTLAELDYVRGLPGVQWADGQLNKYEYSSTTHTDDGTPMGRDFGGNLFDDASGQLFHYHCLVMRG